MNGAIEPVGLWDAYAFAVKVCGFEELSWDAGICRAALLMFRFLLNSNYKFYFIPACWIVSRPGDAQGLAEIAISDLYLRRDLCVCG